jgi:hypothetical protein
LLPLFGFAGSQTGTNSKVLKAEDAERSDRRVLNRMRETPPPQIGELRCAPRKK